MNNLNWTKLGLAAGCALALAGPPALAQNVNGPGNQAGQYGQNEQGQYGNQGSRYYGQNNQGQWGNQNSQNQNHRMNASQVENQLRDQGYSDFQNVNRNGDTYQIGKAKRYGREIQNVEVDAQSEQVQNQQDLNEDQVKQLLKDQGYSSIKHVYKSGSTFTAQVKQNGNTETVNVNADTGSVASQNS